MTTANAEVSKDEVTNVVVKKKFELIPNEIVGYRIRPDQWNWSVVVVKRYGKDAKKAGQEYEEPLPAYCKSIGHAVEVIYDRVAKIEGRELQNQAFNTTGVASDLNSLKTAFDKGLEAALWAVKDLEKRLDEAGIDVKTVNRKMLKGVEETEVVQSLSDE